MIVDAFVEHSADAGATFSHVRIWNDRHELIGGPWSVPHAVELARAEWARWVNFPPEFRDHIVVRVIDTAGIVVEQWPKRSAKS